MALAERLTPFPTMLSGFLFVVLALAGAYLLIKNDPLKDFEDDKVDSITKPVKPGKVGE